MDVEDKSKQNSEIITNILPYLQGDLSSRGASHVKQVNEAQSLKISQIVFIGPNYYEKKMRERKSRFNFITPNEV